MKITRGTRSLVQASLACTLLAGSLLSVGCGRTELTALRPQFEITWEEEFGFVPADLESSTLFFGQVTTGEVSTIQLRASNAGNANLDVYELAIVVATFDENGDLANEMELENDLELTTNAIPGEIENGAAYDFSLRFSPLYGTPLQDGLHFKVSHELNDEAPLYIPITGEGFGDPQPDIYSKPTYIEFGTLTVGQTSPESEVSVGNGGPGLLEVGTVSLDDTANFSVEVSEVEDRDMENGQYGLLHVSYHPIVAGNHTGTITILSNDPDEGSYAIQLNGTGDPVAVGKAPTAVCTASSQGQIGQNITVPQSCPGGNCPSATFDGNASSDPSGLPLTFAWSFSPASGSTSTLSNPTSPNPFFEMNVGGTYSATLVVTNSQGTSSSPCTSTVTAVPNENFRVELSWQYSGDDMDLHLLRASPVGTPRGTGDCYYGNTSPDWGVTGVASDDPALDLDDIPGTGPENINIISPALAPYDGWYQVFVHDYPGSVYSGANPVTVNIYINGVLTQTYNFSISGEDSDYYVAKIQWPSGNIVACNGLAGC